MIKAVSYIWWSLSAVFAAGRKNNGRFAFKPFSAHFRKWACIKDGFYIDDGYSGTTFERPDWKRLTESRERTC